MQLLLLPPLPLPLLPLPYIANGFLSVAIATPECAINYVPTKPYVRSQSPMINSYLAFGQHVTLGLLPTSLLVYIPHQVAATTARHLTIAILPILTTAPLTTWYHRHHAIQLTPSFTPFFSNFSQASYLECVSANGLKMDCKTRHILLQRTCKA